MYQKLNSVSEKKKVDFSNLELKINGQTIERIGEECTRSSFKFVGIHLNEFLSWEPHIKHVRGKLSSANFALSKTCSPSLLKKTIYNSIFKSHL